MWVRVAERYAMGAADRPVGMVRRVFESPRGGWWAAVRFDGQHEDVTYMVRELERADRKA
jgi:hypothetical protein